MFRVFDRYLLKEVINGWLAVTLFLWLILVSNRLVRYLGDAVSGDIPADIIFRLIGLKMVWYLVHVVPFALALGVVLGLGRLDGAGHHALLVRRPMVAARTRRASHQ